MKFGRPKSYRPVKIRKVVIDQLATTGTVRSIHPAIWQRPTGEKVLHISPMQAAGIEGMETPEGDALLEVMCQEMYTRMVPYYHQWRSTDMVVWDNCRFLHSVTGHPPEYARDMRRTVIFGDYGLGRREHFRGADEAQKGARSG
jgi:taurine dioxygenase